MTLTQKLDQDLKQAMIEKNEAKLSALRLLKSALKYSAIEKKVDGLNDADACQVIQKQIKQRKESIEQFSANGRQELADKEKKEVAILENYLPSQIPDAELQQIVSEEAKKAGATTKKDFGRLMKILTDKLSGRADNKRISELLGKILIG